MNAKCITLQNVTRTVSQLLQNRGIIRIDIKVHFNTCIALNQQYAFKESNPITFTLYAYCFVFKIETYRLFIQCRSNGSYTILFFFAGEHCLILNYYKKVGSRFWRMQYRVLSQVCQLSIIRELLPCSNIHLNVWYARGQRPYEIKRTICLAMKEKWRLRHLC